MKRAIYVGKSVGGLEYGMTGVYENLPGIIGPCFKPDGELHAEIVWRLDIYIPSEDLTRHCPKP